MFPANVFVIRPATPDDEPALRRLAYLDGHLPLEGRVLVGELDGLPAAAIGLDDKRLVSDPFRPAGHLRAHLRLRAAAFEAFERTPSVADRIRAGLRPRPARSRAGSY